GSDGRRCLRGRGPSCVGERQQAAAHPRGSVPDGTVMPWARSVSSMGIRSRRCRPQRSHVQSMRGAPEHRACRYWVRGRRCTIVPERPTLPPCRALCTRPSATPTVGGQGCDRRRSHAQSPSPCLLYATNIGNKPALDCMSVKFRHSTYPLCDKTGCNEPKSLACSTRRERYQGALLRTPTLSLLLRLWSRLFYLLSSAA